MRAAFFCKNASLQWCKIELNALHSLSFMSNTVNEGLVAAVAPKKFNFKRTKNSRLEIHKN